MLKIGVILQTVRSRIDPLQCLHFAGYGTHAHITGRQKQTNSEGSWEHPLTISSSFYTQIKTMYTFFIL